MSIQINDVHVQLGTNNILQGIDLSIAAGEKVAIVGPNGCGKSTLLRTLAGIIKPIQGEILINSKPINKYPRKAFAKELGLLSQSDVIPTMTTVRDHVASGRYPYRSYFNNSFATAESAIEEAISLCEIKHLESRLVERLSGGERKRVRIATLLSQSPSIMLLDEPLNALDLEHQYALLNLLETLNSKKHTIIVVLHNLELAMRSFDRLIVMKEGTLIADGAPDEIITTELLGSVFNINAIVKRESESNQPLIIYRNTTFSLNS